jgi:hypothetical protein
LPGTSPLAIVVVALVALAAIIGVEILAGTLERPLLERPRGLRENGSNELRYLVSASSASLSRPRRWALHDAGEGSGIVEVTPGGAECASAAARRRA